MPQGQRQPGEPSWIPVSPEPVLCWAPASSHPSVPAGLPPPVLGTSPLTHKDSSKSVTPQANVTLHLGTSPLPHYGSQRSLVPQASAVLGTIPLPPTCPSRFVTSRVSTVSSPTPGSWGVPYSPTSPVCPVAHPHSPSKEEVEDVHGGAEATASPAATQAAFLHGPLATAVIQRPFVGVRQHLVGLGDLLELGRGRGG